MLIHVTRLSPGDDLRPALENLFAQLSARHGVNAACIVSGIGSFTRASLRYAQQPEGSVIDGPLELLSLAGTLSVEGAHLHASIADEHGNVKGGHVMPGCIIRTTAEVVIALLPRWEFRREMDSQTGYKELSAKLRVAIAEKTNRATSSSEAERDLVYWLSQPVQARIDAVEHLRGPLGAQRAGIAKVCTIVPLKR